MAEHVFTGFGFGPIQGGLFAKEAFESGNFARIVVAEIDADLVDAVRANNGSYYVNVARADGIEVLKIDNVELLDPNVEADRQILQAVLAESTEIVTCLPSVSFYDVGGASSIVSLITGGLKNSEAGATIIYGAENNNHAAEILERAVAQEIGDLPDRNVQFLNTVIGKMSRVVSDPAEIAQLNLETIAPGIDRAFLVEQFNRILVSRTLISDFLPGIECFIEKDDLLAFEEAKLYGHNAIHSLLGFIGAVKGCTTMTELANDKAVMQIGRDAFLRESGAALTEKYAQLDDELFTEAGFKNYAEDLLERMTNPYLGDTVARVVRDVRRKLRIDGRIFGTMQVALEHGIEPENMALGAMAGIAELLKKADENSLPEDLRFGDWRKLDAAKIERIIKWLWNGQTSRYTQQLIKYVQNAQKRLKKITTN
jgi:mannitol-1-phosphate/altronate dehydrogenase